MNTIFKTLTVLLLFIVLSPLVWAGPQEISSGDTAWMLLSAALVLLMTPALAFFYGGLVRSKNVLNTMSMSFSALGFVGVAWVVVGYTIAFGAGNLFLGDFNFAFFNHVTTAADNTGLGIGVITIPHVLFALYQGTFAIITAALISGAVVERMKFPAYVAFITLWAICVYAPMAHWVWGGGIMAKIGDLMGGSFTGLFALDFAGGTVVHINAAVAAVVVSLMVGPRKDYAKKAILPHNVPFVLLGAALLWLGWFGFNAGSAWASGELSAVAFVNTAVAPMATLVSWNLIDIVKKGHATAVGTATAIVVGLVAITPAAGFVSTINAMIIGLITAFPCYFAIEYRAKTKLDDSLDVLAAHGVGGFTGALLTGVFAQKAVNTAGLDGLLYGNPGQLVIQFVAIIVAMVFSAVMTYLLVKLVGLVLPIRSNEKEEGLGMDITQHGEEAYTSGEGAILVLDTELQTSDASAEVRKFRPALA